MSRSLLRSALELRSPITRLPPTFLLPLGARWLSTTPSATTPELSSSIPPAPAQATKKDISSPTSDAARTDSLKTANRAKQEKAAAQAVAGSNISTNSSTTTSTGRAPPMSPPALPTGPIPEQVKTLLPLLRAQPGHYITVHIHGRPYLVTPGDLVRLPFLMPGVSPGDVLRLNRASVLGSRDLTLRPSQPGPRTRPADAAIVPNPRNEAAYIDERLFECRATVVGVESEPMREKEKTKRRNRKVKTIKSKLRFTVLRISELRIKSPEEIEE